MATTRASIYQKQRNKLLFLIQISLSMMMWAAKATPRVMAFYHYAGFVHISKSARRLTDYRSFFTLNKNNNNNRMRALLSSSSSTDSAEVEIPVIHQKSYLLKGISTSPAEEAPPADPPPPGVPDDSGSTRKGRRRRRLKGCGPGVTVTTVKTDHTIQTDIPKAMGGTDLAPQPVELLVASLLGCTQATALFVARQMKILDRLSHLEFNSIIAVRDERGALTLPIEELPAVPSRLQEISGQVAVILLPDAPPLSAGELTLLKEQTEVRCPVANMMIASGCRMKVDWVQQQKQSSSSDK